MGKEGARLPEVSVTLALCKNKQDIKVKLLTIWIRGLVLLPCIAKVLRKVMKISRPVFGDYLFWFPFDLSQSQDRQNFTELAPPSYSRTDPLALRGIEFSNRRAILLHAVSHPQQPSVSLKCLQSGRKTSSALVNTAGFSSNMADLFGSSNTSCKTLLEAGKKIGKNPANTTLTFFSFHFWWCLTFVQVSLVENQENLFTHCTVYTHVAQSR